MTEFIELDKINFTWEDLVKRVADKRRSRGKQLSEENIRAARVACETGSSLLQLRCSYEIYDASYLDGMDGKIRITVNGAEEYLSIGPSAGYLAPARQVSIAICTAGAAIVEEIKIASQKEDYLLMYYLDTLGVMALGALTEHYRKTLGKIAADKNWGVGPFMQPGSAQGWDVSGQKDLFRLGHGGELGLSINDSCFLIPNISDSSLVGLGPEYSSTEVGSLCVECPRRNTCLWRREREASLPNS